MQNHYRLFVQVVALLSMLAPTLALDSLNVTLRGERHDFVDMGYDVVVSNGFAYVATMLTGLRVMDVSSPDTVVEVGFALFHESAYPQSRFADQVAVANNRVYVTYFNGAMDYANYRLIAYDASNPAAPIQTDHIALPDYVKHIFAEGNWVYAAFGDGFPGEVLGVKLIDATDPYDLQVAGTFLTGENPPTGVQSRGDTLFVATRPTLYIVNIADRSQPEIIGSFSPSGEWVYLERVQVQGNYAFLLDWSLGLRVLNISNPTAPAQVASLPLPGGFIPVVNGFKLMGTRLYYVNCEGLPDISTDVYIISIATPTAPQELGTHHLSDSCTVEGFDVENHLACCWTGDFGHEEKLYLLDLQDPDATSETFIYIPPGIPQSIAQYGDYLYVPMSRDGVGIYNAADFPTLNRVGWIPVAEKITVRSPSAIGDKLYLPRTAIAIDSVGIEVRDLSPNPSSPDRIAFILFPPQSGTPLMVDRYDDYLIVAGGMGGIMIFDVTDLNAASLVGQWTLWSPSNPTFSVHALAVDWPIVYAPEKNVGYIHVLDVANPSEIRLCHTISTSRTHNMVDLSADGEVLYSANGTNGLRLYDVSSPDTPQFMYSFRGNISFASQVKIQGECAYVTDGQGIGLHVISVSDPSDLHEIAYHETPGIGFTDEYNENICVDDSMVFMVETTHLEAFQVLLEANTDPLVTPLPETVCLQPAYPNPFNAATTIRFTLPFPGLARLTVYNIVGREIACPVEDRLSAGAYEVTFNGSHLTSGVYFYSLDFRGTRNTRKMLLLK